MTQEQIESIEMQAISKYGKEKQIKMLLEEMSELQDAICKYDRQRRTVENVCEEIADVMIMCEQAALMFDKSKVTDWYQKKIKRLYDRLNPTSKVRAKAKLADGTVLNVIDVQEGIATCKVKAMQNEFIIAVPMSCIVEISTETNKQ